MKIAIYGEAFQCIGSQGIPDLPMRVCYYGDHVPTLAGNDFGTGDFLVVIQGAEAMVKSEDFAKYGFVIPETPVIVTPTEKKLVSASGRILN